MPRDQVYHELDHEGRHYKLVFDDDYQTVGSYAYDTEEETKAAEDEEISKLKSGEWVVLGCIVTTKCKGMPIIEVDAGANAKTEHVHCDGCNGIGSEDSCWGIVVENSTEAAEKIAKEMF